MIEFHDPRADVGTRMEPYTLSHSMDPSGAGTTVGLLANGFPDSENFLNKVGDALTRRLPKIQIKRWNKGNPTVSVSEKALDEIKASCQVAIAAYGH